MTAIRVVFPPRERLRIALIAPYRFPIAEPFMGGLEAHVGLLAATLRGRGHHVSLFAAQGTDALIADTHYAYPVSAAVSGRRDISGDPSLIADEHSAYLSVMTQLAGAGSFDVVHNNSLHYLPVAMAHLAGVPIVSTLHTPPISMVQLAITASVSPPRFVAVSQHTADSWQATAGPMSVVHNGVDTARWLPGPGGGPLIWFGRLVAEKGAELAIAAARMTGRDLDLAGPIIDQDYFRAVIEPQLGRRVRYVGHLPQRELATLVGRASAAVVTPRWDEPYGMVVAEALSCGTPVAAFRRGGIPEILTSECGVMAPANDVLALAGAIDQALGLSRMAARRRAVEHCSARAMVDAYEEIYAQLIVDSTVDQVVTG